MRIMNTTEDVQPAALLVDEAAVFVSPDTNANVSSDTSKGAVPKKGKAVPPKKPGPLQKQPIKLNNNIETMPTLNGDDLPKLNGVANGLPANYPELIEPSCSNLDAYYKYDFKDDSSSDDTELLSVSDDGCIYTYKGDHVADLPSSFFTLDIPPDLPEPPPDRNHTSSPEMDYLEMDFDPGVNGDVDSSSDNENERVDGQAAAVLAGDSCDVIPVASVSDTNENDCRPEENVFSQGSAAEVQPANSLNEETVEIARTVENQTESKPAPPKKTEETDMPWSCTLSQRTKSINFRMTKRCHCTCGELVSPNENMPQIRGASVPTQTTDGDVRKHEVEDVMIWSREEAFVKQTKQLGPSACGATAVLNVLNALRFPIPSIDKIKECVRTRLRRNDSPLTDYLLSRSVAGTTHEDIIDGLHSISNGAIYGRFFHMYPERIVNLYSWLGFWIKNGAVPIATLNLQRCVGVVPDAWHHQMVYGVDSSGIHLTNPLECVEAGLLWPQLCSESVLLIRREDVLSRWNFRTDLPELMKIQDIRWRRINVVGQVANMIHENARELRPGFTNTSHIRIPAAYSSGVTLVAMANSPACAMLKKSPELPLLDPTEEY